MKIVEHVLVSDSLIESQFACNVAACKGACCIEGDLGAPLAEHEIETLKKALPSVLKELDKKSQNLIEKEGFVDYSLGQKSTQCHEDGLCVFATSQNGVLQCGIEKTYQKGNTNFQKPISCHLYPIREKAYGAFTALNYHKWDICQAACQKGQEEEISLLSFAKDALERRFGKAWYQKAKKILQNS